MIYLWDEKEEKLEKIIFDIGKFPLELYIKQILKVKRKIPVDVLKCVNVILSFRDSKRLFIVGTVTMHTFKKISPIILTEYSGIIITEKIQCIKEKKEYIETNLFCVEKGRQKDIVDYRAWLSDSNFNFFSDIPSEQMLLEQYRWII